MLWYNLSQVTQTGGKPFWITQKCFLPAGHQLFTTCSFTSSRRICIIYSSPWRLLGWTVPKHRDKIVFLWAFARGWLERKTPHLWKTGTSAKTIKYRNWTFLHNLLWQHLENPVPLYACSYSSSLAIFSVHLALAVVPTLLPPPTTA